MGRKYMENLSEGEREAQREFRTDARKKLADPNLTDKEKLELLVDYVVGGTKD